MAQRPRNRGPIISKTGTDLILKLYSAIRSIRTAQYDISALHEMLGNLTKKGETLSIQVGKDRLLLNDDWIEMRSGHAVHRILFRELKKRKIGKIEFLGLPGREDLEEFFRSFLGVRDGVQYNGEKLQRMLREKGIESLRVEGLSAGAIDQDAGFPLEQQVLYTRTYFYAMGLVKEMFAQAHRGNGPLDLGLARRVVQNMVTGCLNACSIFMGLATFKNYREFLPNHSVNVAIYAIALGHRLGLSNRCLVDLGLAGLFHDIGESDLLWSGEAGDHEITEQEWDEAKMHPVRGVKIMIGAGGSIEATKGHLMAGIFEHHLRYDHSGFPELRRKKGISLVGRILALADFYDVAARPYGKNRFPCFSGQLLELIAERNGKDFDPVLVKYFAGILGVLPVGTLCRLDTGELGIVFSVGEEARTGDRPWVRILTQAGERYRGGDLIDLASVDEKTGKYRYTIVEILDPSEFKIDVAEYLMAF